MESRFEMKNHRFHKEHFHSGPLALPPILRPLSNARLARESGFLFTFNRSQP